MIKFILALIVSYLLGSIPTAFLAGKLTKGIDIRKFGSGNVGATNAFRVLGKPIGIFVLFFDILKGFFVSAIVASYVPVTFISGEIARIILGAVVIAGHNWTLFLNFRGGKGVATSLGVLFGLATAIAQLWPVLGVCIFVWCIVFIATGYVSLASILCSLSFPISVFIFTKSRVLLVFSALIAAVAIFRHKHNISRLLEKKEHRVNFPWAAR